MIKVGLMGGSFDPIHLGHMLAAETARESCGLNEVWFIPAGSAPLKGNEPAAPADLRLEMVYRAIDFQPFFRAMDVEINREGISYSIDTVAQLAELYPDREFYFIVGADRINDLDQWHRIDELAAKVSFIGLQRPGVETDVAHLPAFIRSKLRLIRMPLIEISSTDIRNRRAEGRSIRFLVPDKVYHFIQRNELYGP
jgi:nicotinate-nucleotide adenylyltransferase